MRDALEQPRDQVVSHLHPVGSFDVADHVVPTGREEVWRFTPLKRLRGIHQDVPLDGHSFEVEVHAEDGVTAESVAPDHGWSSPCTLVELVETKNLKAK